MKPGHYQIFSPSRDGAFKFLAFLCFAIACGFMAGSLRQMAEASRQSRTTVAAVSQIALGYRLTTPRALSINVISLD